MNIKKNFLYQSFWQILTMILPLVTSPLLARVLGPTGVGIYAYLASVEGYYSIVADMGVYRYGIREIAAVKNNKDAINKKFSEIWFIHTVIFIGVGIVYIFYCFFYSKYPTYMIFFFLMYVGDYLKINWLFTGVEDFQRITIIDSVVKIVTFFVICCLIREETDLFKYILIMSISSIISSIVYWKMSPQYVRFVKIRIFDAFAHFKGILILFVPVLMENIYTSMDKVMLGMMSNVSEVGFYDNATKALIANRIICAISLVIMPKMTSMAYNGDNDGIKNLMSRSVEVSIVLSSAFAFGTASISRPFSIVFWGGDFSACARLISLLVIAMPAMALSRIIREGYLISTKQDRKYLVASFGGAVSNCIINAILIPKMGAVGASIATVISEYVVLFIQIFVVRNALNFTKMIKNNLVYLGFGLVMFIINEMVGKAIEISEIQRLMVSISVGALVYMGLCLAWWKVTENEYYLSIVRKIIKR